MAKLQEKKITLWVSNGMYTEVERYAKEKKLNVSEAIRHAIRLVTKQK